MTLNCLFFEKLWYICKIGNTISNKGYAWYLMHKVNLNSSTDTNSWWRNKSGIKTDSVDCSYWIWDRWLGCSYPAIAKLKTPFEFICSFKLYFKYKCHLTQSVVVNDCCFNDTLYSNVYWKCALIRGNTNSNIGQSRAKYNE